MHFSVLAVFWALFALATYKVAATFVSRRQHAG